MSHNLNKHHKSSEEEFMDALEKLEETLELRDRPDGIANAYREPTPQPARRSARKVTQPPQHRDRQEFLLSALEEAAADIDRFIASKNLPSDES